MPDNKTPKYQYDHYDFGDMLDSAVEAGSKIGSSVLGSIADALAQAGDAMSRPQPDSFAAWKRRLKRKWKNGGQSVGVALTAVGWTFTGCFGIAALVLGILTAVGAGPLGLSQQDFIALQILTAVFYPATLGFLFMAIVGMKKLAYFSRLRKLLRAANDWTCDLPALARKAQIKQEKAYETVAKAVANGDLPNAAISDDYSTLYLDDSLMPTAAKPAAAPQAEPAEPLTDAEQFRREGMDFLNYLKVCRGKLGTDADEELAAMQKTCASIMGFVHNHSEQLNRVRRFREYYLPTTRKLLDTAQELRLKGVREVGLSAMLGLGLRDPEAFSALARALFTCAAALHDSFGLQVSYCCLGGGLPVAHRRTERDADIAAVSRGVQAEFSRIMEPAGLGGVPVETGLGRWLTAHAGILLTTVTGVKRGAQDWLGVDVSRADLLRPELYGTYHHISVLGDDRVEGRRRYAVGDRIPEPREPFGQRLLPECRRGARLVIHDVGAYGASMGYSYGLTPHCAEYLYQADGTLRCIRRAQREDELFSTLDENPDFTAPAETPSGQAESQRPSEG